MLNNNEVVKRMEEIENIDGFVYYDYLRFKEDLNDKYIDHSLDDIYLEYAVLEVTNLFNNFKSSLESLIN
jgi:hypothetical protein